jgi:4-carboxymuconolactone decarboxylase
MIGAPAVIATPRAAVIVGTPQTRYRGVRTIHRRREDAMTEKTLREKGADIRRELMGEQFAASMESTVYADPGMRAFRDLAQEIAFGTVWTRPGLDLKTRTLICVVSDTATGRAPELALHLRMALRQGWTEQELTETLLHLTVYIGLPLVREALLTARDTFAAIRVEEKGAG